jgi:HAD superfamily hydrolase (TIGR01509 family)
LTGRTRILRWMSTQQWKRGTGPSLLRGLFTRSASSALAPRALLWDMDGLLVDSEPLWTIAERDLFESWGVEFTAAMKATIVGTRLDVAVPLMIGFGGPAAADAVPHEVATRLLDRMVQLFSSRLPLRAGARELLGEVAQAGIPQALVSSSYRVLVDAVLRGLPEHPFAISVAGDEVARGKPDPEPYEAAIVRLGLVPADCVALEDSTAGAQSAAAAGARVVFCPSVPGTAPPEPGWRPVSSLREVSLPGLRAWMRSP